MLILHRCAAEPGKTVLAYGLSVGLRRGRQRPLRGRWEAQNEPGAVIVGEAALQALRSSLGRLTPPAKPRGRIRDFRSAGPRRKTPTAAHGAPRLEPRCGVGCERLQRQARTGKDREIECVSGPSPMIQHQLAERPHSDGGGDREKVRIDALLRTEDRELSQAMSRRAAERAHRSPKWREQHRRKVVVRG